MKVDDPKLVEVRKAVEDQLRVLCQQWIPANSSERLENISVMASDLAEVAVNAFLDRGWTPPGHDRRG